MTHSLHLITPQVYLKHTGTEKGRGVYALRDFQADQIIEECPVILFKVPFSPPGELKRIIFSWLALAKNSGPYAFALALGFGSLYNHDNPANIRYEANQRECTIRFIAARNIKANEELTINYNALGGNVMSNDNNWFEKMNVRLVSKE